MARIVLTGGGTGGHIFPLISVVEKLREKDKNIELLYLGSGGELERRIMKENSIDTKYIMSGKMRRYFSLANVIDFFKIPMGIIQALWQLLWYMPDVVFSKGGYVSVPVALAAWAYSIPILTHESDAMPGLANRIIGVISQRIAISYPHTSRYFSEKKILLTGNPIRTDIAKGDKSVFLERFALTESKPIILILGGSQGARNINVAITSILKDLVRIAQIIHQTGEANYDETVKLARMAGIKENHDGYYPIPFISSADMKNALSVADIVISRAGANSISEIAANAKPAILIPLSTAANNHQGMNAYFITEKGGAIVLEESNIGRSMLIQKIEKLLADKKAMEKLSENIKEFYHADASDKIAQGILDLAR
ncbi:MAG: undecaprenyldiphospho-muramoylpentapeptide beta-N-acetylglucosaminyltransferase [Parcubacteria group bacterium]|jgi:UDP-N-acetylglucosamine--N-acetylmuramyl-(pentapeptide) pyrophosphoryl-undecaprenol N-acetylglucosamine transferase